MPTYDYECAKCGHHFERFQSMTDSVLRECPKCGGPVKRLISAGAGIIFKGNGFYRTDYKESGSKHGEKPGRKDDPPACEKSDNCPCCK
jgi:putative FmdB family regulatory protein